MPPIHPVAVSAGVIALSVAVAAAIAVYESPEVRRMADDLRRRIAIALQSLGEGIAPNTADDRNREPVFNRPEDAEGFMMSRGRVVNDDGVVADEATRRRQRDELLYWNRIHLEKQKQKQEEEQRRALEDVEKAALAAAAAAGMEAAALPTAATSFDQLLRQDHGADHGTYVVNTGADIAGTDDAVNGSVVRRRRAEGVRGLHAAVYANPFGDEFGIDMDEQREHQLESLTLAESAHVAPDADEVVSDIYNATEPDTNVTAHANISRNMDAVLEAVPEEAPRVGTVSPLQRSEVFFDASNSTVSPSRSLLLGPTLTDNAFATAGPDRPSPEVEAVATDDEDDDDRRNDAFSSIQAWAQNSSNTGFYSPLPVTPLAPLSEPEVISTGDLTPTDSMSLVGDVDVETAVAATVIHTGTANVNNNNNNNSSSNNDDAVSSVTAGRYYDVLSESEDGDGLMTPTSWTEVGSVLSESDAAGPARGLSA